MFRREMFLESVNSAAVNTIGRQQIPIINNSVRKRIFPNISSESFLEQFMVMSPFIRRCALVEVCTVPMLLVYVFSRVLLVSKKKNKSWFIFILSPQLSG